VLSIVLLNIQFNRFGINRYLANTVAIVVTMLWNYTLNKRLGWRTTS
jgi:dolichol-phosphate mannosyltransferase